MNRLPRCFGWLALPLMLSCAGSSAPPSDPRHASECARREEPKVDAATSKRLARATNIVEYEAIWKDTHRSAAIGSINRSGVASVIRSKSAEVRDCYDVVLKQGKNGRGRVVVRFAVDATGEVAHVDVGANDFDEPEVGCCLANRVARWKFPAPVGGEFVVVEYPFVVRVSHGP